MNLKLQKKFNRSEESRLQLLKNLEDKSKKRLNFKISEEKWSIVQIVFHLIKTEHLALISINNSLKKEKLNNSGLVNTIRAFLFNIVLKSKIKIKAPELLRNVPPSYNFEQLKTKWETLRNNLKDLLDSLPNNSTKRILFEHPYAGKFNIKQTLNFLYQHLEHHKKQIENILNAAETKC